MIKAECGMDKNTSLNNTARLFLSLRKRLFFICMIFALSSISCREIFDIFPPDIYIFTPKDQNTVIYRYEIWGKVEEDNLEKIEIYINGDLISVEVEKEFRCIGHFPEEENAFRVKAYDKVGNWSEINYTIYREMPGG
jgi:hypothetical protein